MKSIVVFVCSLSLLLLGLERDATSIFDEGEVLVGAQLVFSGDIPYRDFWTGYGPGQYWIVGTLFKLFGPYILVERVWDVAVRAALATLAYAISRELASPLSSLVTWLFSLGWLWVVGAYGYPLLPAALFGLLSVHLLLKYEMGTSRSWALFAAGASVGLAGIFRHDMGAYAFTAETAAVLLGPIIGASGTPTWPVTRGRSTGWKVGVLVAGALSVTAPVAAYLILHVPHEDLLHPLVIYPLSIYVPTRSLPHPSLVAPLAAMVRGQPVDSSLAIFGNAFALYFPWIMAAIGIASLWRMPRSAPSAANGHAIRFGIWLLSLLVLTFSLKSLVRPHVSHVVHAVVPSFILAGVVLLEARRRHWGLVSTMTIATLAIMAYPPVHTVYRGISTVTAGSDNPVRSVKQLYWSLLERGNGPEPAMFFRIDPDQAAAVSYIRTHTTEADSLFVGNGRHDIVLWNDVLFYFLAQRRPATKYYEFDPGVTTTAEVQAAIIDAIRKARVPYVVRVRKYDAAREPNKSAESSGVVDLDRFLQRHYALIDRFGEYEIRKKID